MLVLKYLLAETVRTTSFFPWPLAAEQTNIVSGDSDLLVLDPFREIRIGQAQRFPS